MKKSDVEFHKTGYAGGALPAVNVKSNLGTFTEKVLRPPAEDALAPELVDGFIAWWEEQDEARDNSHVESDFDAILNEAWQFACERGWEVLQEIATQIFGPSVKVWSEGRSGGWAVVDGLPEFESWDAIALSKWRRFCSYTHDQVSDLPYQMAWGIAVNIYEPMVQANDEAAALDAAAALPIQAGE